MSIYLDPYNRGLFAGVCSLLLSTLCIIFSIILVDRDDDLKYRIRNDTDVAHPNTTYHMARSIIEVDLALGIVFGLTSLLFMNGLVRRQKDMMLPYLYAIPTGLLMNFGLILTSLTIYTKGESLLYIVSKSILSLLFCGVFPLAVLTFRGELRRRRASIAAMNMDDISN